jgi:hypothetical protein
VRSWVPFPLLQKKKKTTKLICGGKKSEVSLPLDGGYKLGRRTRELPGSLNVLYFNL